MAHWLLAASDNAQLDTLPVNQGTLAMLLGIRRTGVSEVLSEFKDEDLITTGREAIVVVDREALSRRACSCWGETLSRRKQRLSGTAAGGRFVADLPVASLVKIYEGS